MLKYLFRKILMSSAICCCFSAVGDDLFSTGLVPNASAKSPGAYELPPSVAQSPEPVVRIIANENLCSAIEVNGKALPPVFNVMALPEVTETADMIVKLNRLGVKFFEFDLQSFEFCKEPGKYDFTILDIIYFREDMITIPQVPWCRIIMIK